LALTRLLNDEDGEVREAGSEALGQIGPAAKTAIPALTELLKDKDRQVRQAAAKALEKIKKDGLVGGSGVNR
jgi:HEAT repeat protein